MNTKEFESIFFAQAKDCEKTLITKAKEYATSDRLHNFRVAAALQNTTERDALCGMMAKHVVSIFDMCRKEELDSLSVWDEKIGDAINYLFLLKAVVIDEQKRKDNHVKEDS